MGAQPIEHELASREVGSDAGKAEREVAYGDFIHFAITTDPRIARLATPISTLGDNLSAEHS